MIKKKYVFLTLVLVLSVAFGGLAHARVAKSVWYESVPEDIEGDYSVRTRSAALQMAFVNAVFDESLEIIGYPITDVRREELRQFITPEAKKFVLSYRELGSARMADGIGQEISVEVSVNDASLKRLITRLGFFKTKNAPILYNPQYSGVQSETWEQLGKLHQLYGLRPDYNAPLVLVMNTVGKSWELSLQGAGAPIAATSDDLATAWHSVWGEYNTRTATPATAATARAGTLQVRGWLFPDGVEAFDRVLRGWVGSASGAKLEAVVLQADSVMARWEIRSKNIDKILIKLSNYVNGRGLTYDFQPAAE